MKTLVTSSIGAAALLLAHAASAASIEDMVGNWSWEGFTIKVEKCAATEVCAVVVAGPKNVGLQMIQTKLAPNGNSFVGKVAHPQTGDTYNSKISMVSANTWHIDGCTAANVCASGDFNRIK